MKLPRIIVVGQLPPPIHGQSAVIQRISQLEFAAFELSVIPMNCSSEIESVGAFQLKKIWTTVRTAFLLSREVRRVDRQALVYYPPASPHTVPVLRDILFFCIARLTVRKWLFHFHAGGLPEFLQGSTFGRIARYFYPKPKVNVSLSEEASLSPGQFFGGADCCVPLGLEVPVSFEARARTMPAHLLFVGNLFISKGVEICIRAVASLRAKGFDVVLDLVGGHVEGDRDEILQLVQDLQLADYVIFHGVLSGAPKWSLFEQATCFVFPSYYPSEKFPNVLIEALGAGLPVVSSQWRGIPALLGDSCVGSTLVPVKDQAAFEQAVIRVLEADDATYQNYRAASRARYLSAYTLEQFKCNMLLAFQQAYSS
jgi:glycosyltransferase involved in cell wall biosynthesis